MQVAPSYLDLGSKAGVVLSDLRLHWDLSELEETLHIIRKITMRCFGESGLC